MNTVDPQELERAIDELETRLDRLRSLYEQYFLGFEKIEPTVVRKDVDRRIWVLRRTQIRNTARRFKLQTLIQRYNTYQQHWARICREIENGTYRRHLAKVEKTFGTEAKTWAAKRRRSRRREEPQEPAARAAEATRQAELDLGALLDGGGDPAADTPAIRAAERLAGERAAPGPHANGRASRPLLDPLELDVDALGDEPPRPAPAQRTARRPALPLPRPTSPRPAASGPAPSGAASSARPGPSGAAPSVPSTPPRRPPPLPRSARANGHSEAGSIPVASPGRAVTRTGPRPVSSSRTTPSGAARPAPPVRPETPASHGGWANLQAGPRPAALRAGAPEAPSKPERAKPRAAGGATDLSDQRIQELHQRLVSTKRSLNQGADVPLETLARNLRSTQQKLRRQHAGSQIDFQVVVKDGKAVVRPVVRTARSR